MKHIVNSIREAVEALLPANVNFRYDVFQWDEAAQQFVSVTGVDVAYPVMRLSIVRANTNYKNRLADYIFVLDYAEPHEENYSNVPDIQERAWNRVNQVLDSLSKTYSSASNTFTFYHSMTNNREAGVSAVCNFSSRLEYDSCCVEE